MTLNLMENPHVRDIRFNKYKSLYDQSNYLTNELGHKFKSDTYLTATYE